MLYRGCLCEEQFCCVVHVCVDMTPYMPNCDSMGSVINWLLPGWREMIMLQQCALPPAKVLPGYAENRERRPHNGTGLIFAA